MLGIEENGMQVDRMSQLVKEQRDLVPLLPRVDTWFRKRRTLGSIGKGKGPGSIGRRKGSESTLSLFSGKKNGFFLHM